MALTDAEIRRLKPAERPYKRADSRGLFLLITPKNAKLWRFKYRFRGREKLLALGIYPDVSLAEARNRREAARAQLASGVEPVSPRRAARREAGGESFEAVAREWHKRMRPRWAESTARTKIRRLELHVFPSLGRRPIAEIAAPELLRVLRAIEAAGTPETALRTRDLMGEVFRYAIVTDRAERDPAADLRGALAPSQPTHRAAVTDPNAATKLLKILDGYDGTIVVRSALRLAPLVFVRPGELRRMEWDEIDWGRKEWTIPARRMKMRQALTVPLARQAVAILTALRPVTGGGRYVFPSARSADRPMSDNAILGALRRSGIDKEEMSGHGFRAMARTILDEVLGVRVDLIEHQLGHAVRDPNGRAYNRTSFLADRHVMMQQWADYLDGLRRK